jgi:hypothetical protein
MSAWRRARRAAADWPPIVFSPIALEAVKRIDAIFAVERRDQRRMSPASRLGDRSRQAGPVRRRVKRPAPLFRGCRHPAHRAEACDIQSLSSTLPA